jgi:hypothetical protein
MTDTVSIPYYRSYLLNGKIVYLDKISELSENDLNLLNIETLARLEEFRYAYSLIEDKHTEEAGTLYRRMKVAGYFHVAIKLKLQN